ncbi:YidH family protein [Acidicapsa ligni]|uniref:YidH family protein n=1 Tax=Acidicapsa ligni TaxID=542300 RepID=UPI0021E0A656|nr:DUF202 domain-containing protein [Acidicapsa ligni]
MPGEQGGQMDDPRVYFAAERTFLAWIRTGLGLMGVGFAVSRFGLFLREMRASDTHVVVHATGLSEISGVALVALGVVVNIAAVSHHIQTVKQLQTGTWVASISRNAVVLALILAAFGVGMGAYLIYLR